MKITVNVTEKNILEGTPQDASCCAIACALREVLSDVDYLEVDPVDPPYTSVYYSQGSGRRYRGVLPDAARKFAGDFDQDKTTVQPISFELELEEQEIDEY